MPCVINPKGRIVPIDDPQEFERWSNTPGFKVCTPEQEEEFLRERTILVKQMSEHIEDKTGIYMATVSEGGTDGYGTSSRLIARELEGLGIRVQTNYAGQKIALLYHNPYSVMQLESPFRIIYTMFESDHIPDDWIEYLQAADKVLVPSHWCQAVFAKSGIKTEVVPLGYDDTIYTPIEREIKRDVRKDFTFLHYNAFNVRKGFPEVFKAFVKAFKQDEPVKLILKTTLDKAPIPILKDQYPNIEVIEGKKSSKELMQIIARSDCFVFPSRGEGFGMTPLEAMATGIPAIVPNAHGISEYFNREFMYEVNVGGTCPGLYSRYKNMDVGNMVICDVDHLAQQMRYVYEHQTEAHEMGQKAAQFAKDWTIRKTAEKLKVIIDELAKKPVPDNILRNKLVLDQV